MCSKIIRVLIVLGTFKHYIDPYDAHYGENPTCPYINMFSGTHNKKDRNCGGTGYITITGPCVLHTRSDNHYYCTEHSYVGQKKEHEIACKCGGTSVH